MSLDNYVKSCRHQINELIESASHEDVVLLHNHLESGVTSFPEWSRENYGQILDYVRSTPAARLKKKRWNDPLQKILLTYAAILHIEAAEILLTELSSTPLEPGRPYRDMAAIAGIAYDNIRNGRDVAVWPFDEVD